MAENETYGYTADYGDLAYKQDQGDDDGAEIKSNIETADALLLEQFIRPRE